MATSPAHIDSQTRAPSRGKPPITASPIFPWVVALWFAALLGVGSLIVPVALLERASVATGLASLLPQAAPPLGFTAQALVAMAGTVGGAMLGLVLARRVTGTRREKPVRRIFSAMEDIDQDGIPADLSEPETGARRRTLAMAEEEGPSEYLNLVPLPGTADEHGAPVALDFAAGPVAEEDEERDQLIAAAEPDGVEEPFELDPLAELTEEQLAEEHSADEFIPPEPHFERDEFVPEAESEDAVDEPDEETEAMTTTGEPLAFSPPSLARDEPVEDEIAVEDGEAGDEDIGETETMPDFGDLTAATPQEYEPENEDYVADEQIFSEAEATVEAEAAPAAPSVQSEGAQPAEGEGLVQLVQRLGATLEKHREWSAEQAAMQAAAEHAAAAEAEEDAAGEAPVPEDFDPAAADDAAEAMAAWFGKSAEPAVEPEAAAEETFFEEQQEAAPQDATPVSPQMRHETFPEAFADAGDEDDLDEVAASFSLPLRAKQPAPTEPDDQQTFDPPMPAEQPAAASAVDSEGEDAEEDDDSTASEEFASLNPFKHADEEFVRIEDEPEPEVDSAEPAVLFPGQEERKTTGIAEPAPRAFDPPGGSAAPASPTVARPKPSNDDNERALREALLNLQRMSK